MLYQLSYIRLVVIVFSDIVSAFDKLLKYFPFYSLGIRKGYQDCPGYPNATVLNPYVKYSLSLLIFPGSN